MKLKYSVNDDILVITLKNEPLSYGEEISGNIIAHYSDKDELVEIEILDANKFCNSLVSLKFFSFFCTEITSPCNDNRIISLLGMNPNATGGLVPRIFRNTYLLPNF